MPDGCFTAMLESLRGCEDMFADMVKDVWNAMRDGGKSIALKKQLLHFNGGLFDKADALSVNQAQLDLLIEAGKADWSHVEPAILAPCWNAPSILPSGIIWELTILLVIMWSGWFFRPS